MNTEITTGEYMLFFRGHDWDSGLSSEELQAAMNRITAWFEGLQEQGKVRGGQPLGSDRKIVVGQHGRIVADGPFAESKEAIGGFLQLQAADLNEAVAIARACPSLQYGVSIEVRPVLAECPVMQRMKEAAAFATA